MAHCRSFSFVEQWRISSTSFFPRRGTIRRVGGSSFLPSGRPVLRLSRGLQSGTGEVISESFKPSSSKEKHEQETPTTSEKLHARHEKVGAFQKLPMVMPSVDILASAKRKARNIPPTKGITNIAKRERNRGAKQLDALMKELAIPLRHYKENFPNKRSLHPYERSLIELTLGEGTYQQVLGKVDSLRKKLLAVGKQHASLCAQSVSKWEAQEKLKEGVERLEEIFRREGHAIDELVQIAKALRAMPVVDLEKPILCLVGAPNVGKSSLVRVLSSGKPEVCNYPFTTRGILMGHITHNYATFQVTDTPGLLTRKEESRNNLEKLTLAVLSYLPTAVLFVHDLTGDCGTSPSDQYITYKELKERFKDHLWLDVVSKSDLLPEPQSTAVEDELDYYWTFGPDGALRVSVTSGSGIDELKIRVYELLISQMANVASEKIEEPPEVGYLMRQPTLVAGKVSTADLELVTNRWPVSFGILILLMVIMTSQP